jgi:ribosomal RNA-processing protein 1
LVSFLHTEIGEKQSEEKGTEHILTKTGAEREGGRRQGEVRWRDHLDQVVFVFSPSLRLSHRGSDVLFPVATTQIKNFESPTKPSREAMETVTPVEHHEQQLFARSLVHPDKKVRTKTLKELSKYISSLQDISDEEMIKLWKALFYCLWLTDQSEIQQELCQSLANLMNSFTNTSLIFTKYLRMFFQILFYEWHHLDQYRLNKFYSLIRIIIRKAFEILYSLHWPKQNTAEFLTVLTEDILNKHPNGPRYHLCDIYLTELLVATNGGDINTDNFILVMKPFFSCLGLATDATFYNRLVDRLFSDYVTIYAREHSKEPHPPTPENGHTLVQHEVVNGHLSLAPPAVTCFKHVSSVKIQMVLFDIASSDPTAEPLLCLDG